MDFISKGVDKPLNGREVLSIDVYCFFPYLHIDSMTGTKDNSFNSLPKIVGILVRSTRVDNLFDYGFVHLNKLNSHILTIPENFRHFVKAGFAGEGRGIDESMSDWRE